MNIRINSFGIKTNTLKWLKSYLHNRKQVEVANGIISKESIITCGVPQGSTLGPLLFIMYINDINKNFINSKIRLFADDTVYTTSTSVDTARDLIQVDLDFLDSWCEQHKLAIHTNKTKCFLFGANTFNKNITCAHPTIAGDEVQLVNDYKYLGTVLDKKYFI